MRCVHINLRKAAFILLSFFINSVHHSQIGDNLMDISSKDQNQKATTAEKTDFSTAVSPGNDVELHCPTDWECKDLYQPCLNCKDMTSNCHYGKMTEKNCSVKSFVKCKGKRDFKKRFICRYCYQTEPWEQVCNMKNNCNSIATPKAYFRTNCTVKNEIMCLGKRAFFKNIHCNWTGGYRWSTALALSITLGGFGADRFYLGHWQEGIGKLFSFGGLGVWTLIDVILISLHYLGPADGSLYI